MGAKLVNVKHLTPSLKGWTTNDKGAPSPHEERLVLLDTNPVFQSLRVVNLMLF